MMQQLCAFRAGEPAAGPPSPVKRNKIASNYPSLNGLRFLAAVAVVCFHYFPSRSFPWLGRIFASGPAAVGFFFLLSGFVLALHHPRVPRKAKFWRARLLRIYPMYLFAFLLFAPIALQKYHHDPKALVASLAVNVTMLQAWTSLAQSWNGPSWSLSVEAFLYLSFPLLVHRIGAPFRVGARFRLLPWALCALLPSLATLGFCLHWIPAAIWKTWIGNNPMFWLPVFCLGIALGLWRDNLKQVPGRALDLPVFAVLAALVALAILWPPGYREMLINGGAALLLGLLIVLCTFRAPVSERLLGNRAMDRLGKASYITYIVQAPLWHYYMAAVNLVQHKPLAQPDANLPQFLAFVAVLLGASLLLDEFVDEPVRRWFSRNRKAARAVSGEPETGAESVRLSA